MEQAQVKQQQQQMKFFFHGVVPSSLRRDLASGLITLEAQKLIPSQIIQPDGQIAIGNISGENSLSYGENNPSLLPNSPFIVISAPQYEGADLRRKNMIALVFKALVLIDFFLITLNATGALQSPQVKQILEEPSRADVLVAYFTNVVVLALGFYGFHCEDLLFLSFFLISTLVDFFINFMRVVSTASILHLAAQIVLCYLALKFRNYLLFHWQSTRVA